MKNPLIPFALAALVALPAAAGAQERIELKDMPEGLTDTKLAILTTHTRGYRIGADVETQEIKVGDERGCLAQAFSSSLNGESVNSSVVCMSDMRDLISVYSCHQGECLRHDIGGN